MPQASLARFTTCMHPSKVEIRRSRPFGRWDVEAIVEVRERRGESMWCQPLGEDMALEITANATLFHRLSIPSITPISATNTPSSPRQCHSEETLSFQHLLTCGKTAWPKLSTSRGSAARGCRARRRASGFKFEKQPCQGPISLNGSSCKLEADAISRAL